ncbi:MAG: ABC transporter ATP-binding protein [Suipraeoptans sp.]
MLNVENLHKSYKVGNTNYEVLKGVNLSVAGGEFVAVMGLSGSGKSTLLNCMSCYIPYEKGRITLSGQEVKGVTETELAKIRNEKLGFVFQDFMLLDGLTIKENILVPKIIQGNVKVKEEKRAQMLMELFGIIHTKDKYPAEISGGERQRTAVARALINDPLVILADEPTGNLDSKSSNKVIQAFKEARDKLDATIFMVTHDSFAASRCDRVIILKDGVVYKNLEKQSSDNEFQDELLLAIKEMSEVNDDDAV